MKQYSRNVYQANIEITSILGSLEKRFKKGVQIGDGRISEKICTPELDIIHQPKVCNWRIFDESQRGASTHCTKGGFQDRVTLTRILKVCIVLAVNIQI